MAEVITPDPDTPPADEVPATTTPNTSSDDAVAASTHGVLRTRLEAAATELVRRANALNDRRVEAFGASQLELIGTERVWTDDNVVPRDIEAVGHQLIMAYNAVAGVRGELRPEEVFSVHHLEERDGTVVLSPNAEGLAGSALDDDRFVRDFQELQTYFKEARVQQVYRSNDKLLAVFRTGSGLNDLRVCAGPSRPTGPFRTSMIGAIGITVFLPTTTSSGCRRRAPITWEPAMWRWGIGSWSTR